jgi:hypothetical protein
MNIDSFDGWFRVAVGKLWPKPFPPKKSSPSEDKPRPVEDPPYLHLWNKGALHSFLSRRS